MTYKILSIFSWLWCLAGIHFAKAQADTASLRLALPESFYNIYSLGAHGLLVMSDNHVSLVDDHLKLEWTIELKVNPQVEIEPELAQENICFTDSAIYICSQSLIAELDYNGRMIVEKRGLVWVTQKFFVDGNRLCILAAKRNLRAVKHYRIYCLDPMTLNVVQVHKIDLDPADAWAVINRNEDGYPVFAGMPVKPHLILDAIDVVRLLPGLITAPALKLKNSLGIDTICPEFEYPYLRENVFFNRDENSYYVVRTFKALNRIGPESHSRRIRIYHKDGFVLNHFNGAGQLIASKRYSFPALAEMLPFVGTNVTDMYFNFTACRNGISVLGINADSGQGILTLDSMMNPQCGATIQPEPYLTRVRTFGIANKIPGKCMQYLDCKTIPLIASFCGAYTALKHIPGIKYSGIFSIGDKTVFAYVAISRTGRQDGVYLVAAKP